MSARPKDATKDSQKKTKKIVNTQTATIKDTDFDIKQVMDNTERFRLESGLDKYSSVNADALIKALELCKDINYAFMAAQAYAQNIKQIPLAIKIYMMLAGKKHPKSFWYLARIYHDVYGNFDESISWCQQGIDKVNSPACKAFLAFILLFSRRHHPDTNLAYALKILNEACKEYQPANTILGQCFLNGLGTLLPRDTQKAIHHLKLGADPKLKEDNLLQSLAAYLLAGVYASGEGLDAPYPALALEYYKRAASLGHLEAMIWCCKKLIREGASKQDLKEGEDYLNILEKSPIVMQYRERLIDVKNFHGILNKLNNQIQKAFQYFKEAVDLRDSVGKIHIAYLLVHHETDFPNSVLSENRQMAIRYMTSLEKESEIPVKQAALLYKGILLYKESKNDKDIENALSYIKRSALMGSIEAVEFLKKYYFNRKDDCEFAKWQERSANNGCIGDCYDFGQRLLRGDAYVSADKKRAFEYFKQTKAIDSGAGWGMIGLCHLNGYGTPINFEQAYLSFSNAAEKNYHQGIFCQAQCLLYGIGIKENIEQALVLLKKIKDHYPAALLMLGWCALNGMGMPKDINLGLHWMCEAEQQNQKKSNHSIKIELMANFDIFLEKHPIQFFNLGISYLLGIGVSENIDKASELFLKQKDYSLQAISEFFLNPKLLEVHRQKLLPGIKKLLECEHQEVHLQAALALGIYYYEQVKEREESFALLKRVADTKGSEAPKKVLYYLGRCYRDTIGTTRQIKLAFHYLYPLVRDNLVRDNFIFDSLENKEDLSFVAGLLLVGDKDALIEPNPTQAIYLLNQMMESDSPQKEETNGQKNGKSYDKKLKKERRIESLFPDNAPVLYQIALLYLEGTHGLEKNIARAISILRRGAKLEHKESTELLACYLQTNFRLREKDEYSIQSNDDNNVDGILSEDLKIAFELWSILAKGGSLEAEVQHAWCLLNEIGCPQNIDAALKIFEKARDKEYSEAELAFAWAGWNDLAGTVNANQAFNFMRKYKTDEKNENEKSRLSLFGPRLGKDFLALSPEIVSMKKTIRRIRIGLLHLLGFIFPKNLEVAQNLFNHFQKGVLSKELLRIVTDPTLAEDNRFLIINALKSLLNCGDKRLELEIAIVIGSYELDSPTVLDKKPAIECLLNIASKTDPKKIPTGIHQYLAYHYQESKTPLAHIKAIQHLEYIIDREDLDKITCVSIAQQLLVYPEVASRSVKILHTASQNNFRPALMLLCQCYYHGVGVTKDCTKALSFLEPLVQQKDKEACLLLGSELLSGIPSYQPVRALELLRIAAGERKGDAEDESLESMLDTQNALYNLALIYLDGLHGMKKDPVKVVKILQQSLKLNPSFREGQELLASCYLNIFGNKIEFKEVEALLMSPALSGSLEAQNNLGWTF